MQKISYKYIIAWSLFPIIFYLSNKILFSNETSIQSLLLASIVWMAISWKFNILDSKKN